MTTGAEQSWFRLAPCGLIATTIEGKIVEINDTLLSWTRFAEQDVVGKPFASLLDAGSRLFYENRHKQVLHLEGSVNDVALTMRTADGRSLPVLLNSVVDAESGLIRSAAFNATERRRYERELIDARRAAESSERRVRVLQDISSRFGLSASDEDVADTFAAVARDAFAARDTAVLLFDGAGALTLMGGTNPLGDLTASLRTVTTVTVIERAGAAEVSGDISAALGAARLNSLSITPLMDERDMLGILVCFFGRRREFDEHFYDLQNALGRQASQTLTRVRLQRRLAFLALHDQLTGVANRELLQQHLDDGIAAAVEGGEPLSVLFLDVDDFKSINDRFGHATGDMVLVELAARLRAGVRTADVVGRIGGDEFVALCPGAGLDDAVVIAERILKVMQEPIRAAGHTITASVSVGVSLYRPGVDPRPDSELLLGRADRAMYESKGAGKNRATLAQADA